MPPGIGYPSPQSPRQATKKPKLPGQPQSPGAETGGAPQSPLGPGGLTFAQMQMQGLARPAPPSFGPMNPTMQMPVLKASAANPMATANVVQPPGDQPQTPVQQQAPGTPTPAPPPPVPPPTKTRVPGRPVGGVTPTTWPQTPKPNDGTLVPGHTPMGTPTDQNSTDSPWNQIFQDWLNGGPMNPQQDQQIQQLLQQLLGNPNPYTSDMVMDSFNRMNQGITEQGDIERQRIQEEMAMRGLGDSTIHGGRLGDVAIQQTRARTNMAEGLAQDAARQQSESVQSAIAAAMGYGQNQFDQQRNRLGDAFGGQQAMFNQWLQTLMANQGIDQQQQDFWLRMMGL